MREWTKMASDDQPSVPTIYLVRHGKTKLNTDGKSPDKIRGWTDVPLDDTGLQQAKDVGKFFKGKKIDAIFTSDLKRCEHVAEAISEETGVPITESSVNFRPWNLGEFQGRDSGEITEKLKAKYLNEADTPVPGGESFLSFAQRYLSSMRGLMKKLINGEWQAIIIVAHYRNLKLAEAWIVLGAKDHVKKSTFLTDDTETASIVEITYQDGKWMWNKLEDTGVEGEHDKEK